MGETPRAGAGQDEIFEHVSQVVLAVASQLSVRDVLQKVVRSARSLAGARYAALGVPGEHDTFAEFLVDGLTAQEQAAIGPLPRQHGILAVAHAENQLILGVVLPAEAGEVFVRVGVDAANRFQIADGRGEAGVVPAQWPPEEPPAAEEHNPIVDGRDRRDPQE